jgi:hypothetical protein
VENASQYGIHREEGNSSLFWWRANQLIILGPEIENYSLDQISALQNYVDNPFDNLLAAAQKRARIGSGDV